MKAVEKTNEADTRSFLQQVGLFCCACGEKGHTKKTCPNCDMRMQHKTTEVRVLKHVCERWCSNVMANWTECFVMCVDDADDMNHDPPISQISQIHTKPHLFKISEDLGKDFWAKSSSACWITVLQVHSKIDMVSVFYRIVLLATWIISQ